MSDCYKYLGPEERFRAIAYETASKTLNNMTEPVDVYHDDIKKLDELKGVGESIAEKIVEYLHSGKIETFEKLKKKVPYELLELLDIEGIGPAAVRKIHSTLNVKNIQELKEKISAKQSVNLKGVSARQLDKITATLNINSLTKKRIPLKKALQMGNQLVGELTKSALVKNALLAGSIRRQKETIGDIDIVVTALGKNHKEIINIFQHLPMVKKTLAAGNKKASVIIKEDEIQADIRVVNENQFGAALLYFTGSKEHNIQLRKMAQKKGCKLNEYGLFEISSKKRIAGESEQEIYNALDINYIEPEKRLGKNELNEYAKST